MEGGRLGAVRFRYGEEMSMRSGWLRHQHHSHTLWHVAAYAGGVVVAYLILARLAPILSPIVAAMGIAYLLDPLVEWLVRKGLKRSVAVSLILVGFLAAVVGGVAILIPLVSADVARFAKAVPALVERTAHWAEAQFGVHIPATWQDALRDSGGRIQELVKSAGKPILESVAKALGSLVVFLIHLLELLLVPVFAFYFLLDWPRIRQAFVDLVPPRRRDDILGTARDIDRVVSGWVRGQLTVVAVLAVLYPIALAVVGIQLAVPVGILAGMLTFIPYIGTVVGFGLAALMAVLGWSGPGPLLGVIGVFVVLHLLESMVLTPVLVGKRVGLGEAGALFAALAGAELLTRERSN